MATIGVRAVAGVINKEINGPDVRLMSQRAPSTRQDDARS